MLSVSDTLGRNQRLRTAHIQALSDVLRLSLEQPANGRLQSAVEALEAAAPLKSICLPHTHVHVLRQSALRRLVARFGLSSRSEASAAPLVTLLVAFVDASTAATSAIAPLFTQQWLELLLDFHVQAALELRGLGESIDQVWTVDLWDNAADLRAKIPTAVYLEWLNGLHQRKAILSNGNWNELANEHLYEPFQTKMISFLKLIVGIHLEASK